MKGELRLGKGFRALNVDLVEKGVEVEPPMAPGVTFTVLPFHRSNRRFIKAASTRALKRDIGGEKEAESFTLSLRDDPEFVAQALVSDWSGVLDQDDNEVEYSAEACAEVLAREEARHLLDWLGDQSLSLNAQIEQGIEADSGNSRSGSSGKKAGAGKSAKKKPSKP